MAYGTTVSDPAALCQISMHSSDDAAKGTKLMRFELRSRFEAFIIMRMTGE